MLTKHSHFISLISVCCIASEHSSSAKRHRSAREEMGESPGPVCMEKGFASLPVNPTQAVATVAVRIWFGSHA